MSCGRGSDFCGFERLLDALAATNLTTATDLALFFNGSRSDLFLIRLANISADRYSKNVWYQAQEDKLSKSVAE